ncbi:MAG: LytTR family DNA-binding domain-containing protein, partial [Bacteroidota bacterium]
IHHQTNYMNELTAILVDDEFSALNGLRQKMERLFPDISILGNFQKPEEAIAFLEKETPDIVFLDIEMPRMTGFELLGKLGDVNFQVIFVTAYSEYALEALKKNAVDYVLKPVDNADLQASVAKAIARISERRETMANENLVRLLSENLSRTNKLIIPTSKGMSFIPMEEVIHLEGDEGYTRIHLDGDTTILSSYSLGKFEKMLGDTFFKCHKSHIINIPKVRSFENEGYVVLENTHRVPISRANRKVFLDLFN